MILPTVFEYFGSGSSTHTSVHWERGRYNTLFNKTSLIKVGDNPRRTGSLVNIPTLVRNITADLLSKPPKESVLSGISTWKSRKDRDFTRNRIKNIAIGLAITSARLYDVTEDNIRVKIAFFKHLLPSFCRTATSDYRYGFYMGHDYNDYVFIQEDSRNLFMSTFDMIVRQMCSDDLHVTLHMVRCDHSKSPARAQNDAMIEAYLNGAEYFYRVNDDTTFETPGWLQDFLSVLSRYSPKNIGVVGPRHYGGNSEILAYDFVHRSHIDIFGCYYPYIFKEWFADNWMTMIYGSNRTTKQRTVDLRHTQEMGQRYQVTKYFLELTLKKQVNSDKDILKR